MPKEIEQPTLEELEIALDEAVSALVAYRAAPPQQAERARARREKRNRILTPLDLNDLDFDKMRAATIARAPVEHGLKEAIKSIGKLIHERVGDDGMLEVAERVCDLDPENAARRMPPIDTAWNGIGSWYS